MSKLRPTIRRQAQLFQSPTGWFTPAVLASIAIYLYANLFLSPGTPFLLSGDQLFFWMNAQRMLYGQHIYVEFFQFTPPGTDFVYFALFKTFGSRIEVTNWTVLVLGVALCWACLAAARQIMGRSLALLATAMFLAVIYDRLLNGTHHFFSLVIVMFALTVAMRPLTKIRILAVGALLGLASFFTQTHGAAGLLACTIFVLWQGRRTKLSPRAVLINVALLWASYSGLLLVLYARILVTVGPWQLWYFQVQYPARYVVPTWNVLKQGLPQFPTWRSLLVASPTIFVYFVLPIAYSIALLVCWRRRNDPACAEWPAAALLSLAGLSLLIETAPNPNWLRVYAVAMPGLVLTIWLLGRAGTSGRYALGILWVATVSLGIAVPWARHHHRYLVAELPAGKVALDPIAYGKLGWLQQHTHPGEFFFQAVWPGVYLPLKLRNPLFIDALTATDETRPKYVEAAIAQLGEKQVRYILWAPRLDAPESDYPGQDHLSPIRDYLHTHYRRVWTFVDQDQLWERN